MIELDLCKHLKAYSGTTLVVLSGTRTKMLTCRCAQLEETMNIRKTLVALSAITFLAGGLGRRTFTVK
jgi:hypothetical protein